MSNHADAGRTADTTIRPADQVDLSAGPAPDDLPGTGSAPADEPGEFPAVERYRPPLPFDTSVAHPARVYDVWLGGKDNFAPDREAARKVMEHNRAIVPGVRANRSFLARVVRHLAGTEGIDQFLDLGTGLPAADNVHEVAQSVNPQARVVYVDNDPIVLAHAHALLTGAPGTIAYLEADLHDATTVLAGAALTLDFSRPIAVLLLMSLQFIEDGAAGPLVAALLDAVPSGSFLVVSHPASDVSESANEGTRTYNSMVSTGMTRRSKEEILAFFHGLEILQPGAVPMPFWRPDPGDEPPRAQIPAYAVVGRKP
ncbi:MAG TPA: SAM-dependent methyltransferase [Kineosporiaceae bacterium]|nr:SAM-dependent methyltransferase [Kineosporiaceae bacterium]